RAVRWLQAIGRRPRARHVRTRRIPAGQIDRAMSFINVQGRRLEYERIPGDPVIVFLHEGLGSVAMWKDFPARCAQAAGCGALTYSRYGYGQSDPLERPRPVDYMHDEALKSLPELLGKLEIERPIVLGHSDGASIALIYAGTHDPRGVIVMAPH